MEHGLEQSPHNPQIILFLLSLCSSPQPLNASSRVIALFRSLDVKQIQLDSLSYLFLSSAISSGLYSEATQHCVSVLGIHRSSASDVPDYAKKSMLNGFYPVTEDMMNFQRFKMQRSVQLLEAKGLIMDFAPLIFFREGENRCLGKVHGLVGGENDEVRAMKMTYDACDFFGAPSIMKIVQGQAKEYADIIAVDSERYEDNRDFSVWNFVIRIERTREANGLWRTSEK